MLSNGIAPFTFFVFARPKGRKRNYHVGTRNGMADRFHLVDLYLSIQISLKCTTLKLCDKR